MLGAARAYLLVYNCLQFIGWGIALARVLGSCFSAAPFHGAYASAGDLICFLQTVSFLEVLHAAVGLVPSGMMLSLMQWGGRTHFLLAIVRQIAEVQELPSVFITFLAWSISEAIRYSHYALTGMGFCPQWLIYLRYTAFIPLYPLGVGPGEMWLMYQSLPFIKGKNLYSSFFGNLQFSYHTFVTVLLLFYPFLWLKLYLHLFKLRRSKLRKHHARKSQ